MSPTTQREQVPAARVCEAPGCVVPLADRSDAAKFCTPACRAAAWKASVGYGRGARKPVKVRSHAPSRKPSRRLAWGRAVEVVATHVGGSERAERILAAALPKGGVA